MNRRNVIITSLLIAASMSGVSTQSVADVPGFSASVKGGQARVSAFDDFDGISVEEGNAFGVTLGYSFAPNMTAELEYVAGAAEITGNLRSLDVDVTTLALYAAFRSSGPLYFIGRLGYVSLELAAEELPDTDDTGLSYGLGGGYQLTPSLGLEVDYTVVEEDTDWLMLSARFKF